MKNRSEERTEFLANYAFDLQNKMKEDGLTPWEAFCTYRINYKIMLADSLIGRSVEESTLSIDTEMNRLGDEIKNLINESGV